MRNRGPAAPARDRATAEEGSLRPTAFVGSFPTPDFRVAPPLPELALIGRSNVGKSSLLNALVGRKALARTSQSPGKTQTCNVYRVGDACYLVDLPGYGYARASKRARAGFHRLLRGYLTGRRPPPSVLWLLDIRHDPSTDDLEMADLLANAGLAVLVALTKADKVGRSARAIRCRAIADAVAIPASQIVVTSVRSKEGVETLQESVRALMTAPAGPGGDT